MSRQQPLRMQRRVGMNQIIDKVRIIAEKYRPEKIILFGSHASGNAGRHSDVDLLVIASTDKSTWDLAVEISSAIEHSFPMDIIVRTPQDIARRLDHGDFFVKEIMENGKVLYERDRP